MRSATIAAAAVLAVLSACGSDGSSDDSAPKGSGDPSASATSLKIVVTPAEDAKTSTYRLTCDPAGGDHPQAQQACDALAEAGASVFDAVPKDRACTTIYGGPQTASVTGTFDGEKIDATFSRADGCEIERWEKLGTTFFNVPLQ
ncbi:SSI family serine proteinase inhibitor [Aeromicrobium wangtongii]|uniref:Subtilase-type protease inhibitor n=1 Tax=Aeromicrobium wangtongii TaxID=2969247 RepID=A0ABY5M751_9ACTN|nr:SSI family serine proteinase inhibitor [Aeromicrobium wangtongii]MCD9199193.1 subtilase-type protease inhibitor [Aeromicrobium wangtongii]UUP12779.1 subtilase-type protease inhibitor [Aeromicrobium wangtongii]